MEWSVIQMTKPLVYFKRIIKIGGGFYLNIPKIFVDSNDLTKKDVRLIIRDLKTIEVKLTEMVSNNKGETDGKKKRK